MIRRIKLSILIIILFGFGINVSAQSNRITFVILLFEKKYKISQHGKESYYWIVCADSVKANYIPLAHSFLKNFSVNNLEDCRVRKDIDPFLVENNSNYKLDSLYSENLRKSRDIIFTKKKKIMHVERKWESGQQEKIPPRLVFLKTPPQTNFAVVGFLKCRGVVLDQPRTEIN